MSRPRVLPDGIGTRLYLPKKLKIEAAEMARRRYGASLSEVVRRLLAREVEHEKGTAHVRPRRLSA